MTIVMGHHVTLDKIMKITLKVNGVTGLVSCKETTKVHPDLMSSGAMKLNAHVQQFFRYVE
jgi:hypothetical protein